jgi:hypothetical protein
MATKRKVAAILALAAGLGLGAAQTADSPPPLVRRDLLVFGSGEPPPLVRDIFRPKAASAAAPAVRLPSGPARPEAQEPPAEAAPAFTLSLSYLGSIRAGGRTIGLVLRGGQTMDVAEGDTIAPGYRVISVTSEAIVVEGPNGERRTFAKQGDRP